MGLVEKYSSKFANANGSVRDVLASNFETSKVLLETLIKSKSDAEKNLSILKQQVITLENELSDCSSESCQDISKNISEKTRQISLVENTISQIIKKIELAKLEVAKHERELKYASKTPNTNIGNALRDANKLEKELRDAQKSFEQKLQEQKSNNKNILIGIGAVVVVIGAVTFLKR